MAKYNPLPRVDLKDRRWPDRNIEKEPYWCSVDLRDGNQALAVPMSIETKLNFFEMLVEIGFKEIEVGFPSASQIEFDFLRRLIEEERIPGDVTIQVLTQAREHLIRRTFEGLRGIKQAIVHLYNSTSPMQRQITFRKSKAEILDLAVAGTKLVRDLLPEIPDTRVLLQYSPESFSDTETDFALEICTAVMDEWRADEKGPIILNLPATVEWATPNVYADQIEWFCRNLPSRERAIISLHTHNDRGTGVAATELGLLAGADRVEGTLFGNGERTGNLDLVTTALNMYSTGVPVSLDFHNLPEITKRYEKYTGMSVHPRQPYAGDLVFTAFSGSHQDAIKKGMDKRRTAAGEEAGPWNVPYLPIDPQDIGRTYEAIIRINSQSGKGGVAYVLSRDYGLELPRKLHPQLGKRVNELADTNGRELLSREVYELFKREYLNLEIPLKLVHYEIIPPQTDDHTITCKADVIYNEQKRSIVGRGNGPLDAFVHALREADIADVDIQDFHEHSVGIGSQTEAISYVEIRAEANHPAWGAGMDTNINLAGLKAVVSACNRSF